MRIGVGLLVALAACGDAPEDDRVPVDPVARPLERDGPPNVLLILVDDLGTERLDLYGAPTAYPRPSTPTLDALADEALVFDRAWAHPTCTPSRAALLTGRYGARSGLGRWIYAIDAPVALPEAERTIAEMLREHPEQPYATAAFGKWHLVGFESGPDPYAHPLRAGFDTYRGAISNPQEGRVSGRPRGYYRYDKVVDGEVVPWGRYLTVDTTDDAVEAVLTLPEPWFVYVPYHAVHSPWEAPPDGLADADAPATDDPDLVDRMAEALDAEIARLLDALEGPQRDRTQVWLVGDNGTPAPVRRGGWAEGRNKGTLYELGVRVPMMVFGAGVERRGERTDALVHLVDVLPTVQELAGLPPRPEDPVVDGVSLLPLLSDPLARPPREVLYNERFFPNGLDLARSLRGHAVRSDTHKLLWDTDLGQAFFRYGDDPFDEGAPLAIRDLGPEDQAAYEALGEALDGWVEALGHAPIPR